MKKIFLIISIISFLFLVGCNENKNVVNNQLENDIDQNISNIEKEDVNDKSGDIKDTIGVKTLNEDERLELIRANDIENKDLNEIEFAKLKLNSEQSLNINSKNLTFKLDITNYEIISDYTLRYNIQLTSYDKDGKIIANYYLQDEASSQNILDELLLEKMKVDIQDYLSVNIGIIKAKESEEFYLIFQMFSFDGGENFYLYTIDGKKLLYCFSTNMGMYLNHIEKDTDYIMVDAINYCEDEILVYDMYNDFVINEENIKYQEKAIVNETDLTKDNVRHKITIENGNVVDKIVKIYADIPKGQF